MPVLTKFGDDKADPAKAAELARKLGIADKKRVSDAGLNARIEKDPMAALAELELTGAAAKSFRILEGVTTRDSCSCNCYFTACGTGVGCFNSDGHGSASSGC